jgi:hypothetical protein
LFEKFCLVRGVSYVFFVKKDQDNFAPVRSPRTWTVLGLLALTALTFSYLGSYAVTGALVKEHLISAWPLDRDPRPRWLATGFCVLMLVFMGAGEFLRRWGKSDFAAIDEMVNATDEIGN